MAAVEGELCEIGLVIIHAIALDGSIQNNVRKDEHSFNENRPFVIYADCFESRSCLKCVLSPKLCFSAVSSMQN